MSLVIILFPLTLQTQVLFLNEAAIGASDVATTSAGRPKHERAQFDRAELARLIHHVIAADDKSGQDFDNENEDRKVTKLFGAAEYSEDEQNLLKKNLLALGTHADLSTGDYEIRLHLIKNPEVLQKYREDLRKRHESTSSGSGYDDSLEYDRKMENFIRRNAVFRLGRLSDQPLIRENAKLSLRNDDTAHDKRIRNSREDEKATHFGGYDDLKEKILVSFKDTKHDDWDKSRIDDKSNLRNKNNNDDPAKKGVWDEITKNANKWEHKNNDYKNNDNLKKEKYDYDSWNSKPKQKESKFNDWDKPNKDNSWDNWKSKSMEKSESYNRGSDKRDNPRINDDLTKKNNDWYKPKKSDDWDRPNMKNDWDKPSKKDDWNKPNMRDDWDKPNKKDDWEKPSKKEDWDKPSKKDDWDKPNKQNDWEKPSKNNDWDKPKSHDWDEPKKATKGIASYEKEYNFKKDETRKTTNEWDRAIAKSVGANERARKKPFVPVISDYYNPRPRMRDTADIHGIKLFGRTSIPFVGKKGIYDEK